MGSICANVAVYVLRGVCSGPVVAQGSVGKSTREKERERKREMSWLGGHTRCVKDAKRIGYNEGEGEAKSRSPLRLGVRRHIHWLVMILMSSKKQAKNERSGVVTER